MKILHFVPYLREGGVANVWINLTKALAKLGIEVYLVGPLVNSLKGYVNVYKESKASSAFIKDPLYTLTYAYINKELVMSILRRESIEILLTHGPLATICLDKTISARVKCYSVIHGTYTNEVKWMRFHPLSGLEKVKYMLGIGLNYYYDMRLYKLLSRKGIKFIAVSQKTKEELVNAGVKEESVYSILNGVEKKIFKVVDKEKSREYLKKKFNANLEGFVIAHVGLGPIKGTHMLVKTLALLKKKSVKFTAIFVGRLGPPKFRHYVEEMIRSTDLSKNVVMTGHIRNEDLPYIYNVADVTVVPSYSEGSPLVIPESLACNTPVIATNVGGNIEYLSRVDLSDLVINIEKYDLSSSIYEKLIKVLEQNQLYRKVIKREKIPSWIEIAREYVKVMDSN